MDRRALKGLVVYNSLGTLYDPERPAVGRRGYGSGPRCDTCWKPMVGLRTLGLRDSRGVPMGLRGVNIQFGLADTTSVTCTMGVPHGP